MTINASHKQPLTVHPISVVTIYLVNTCSHTRKDALAAVTVPCGLTKAALSFAICSGVDTRMPLSLLTVVTFLLPSEREGEGGRGRERGRGEGRKREGEGERGRERGRGEGRRREGEGERGRGRGRGEGGRVVTTKYKVYEDH